MPSPTPDSLHVDSYLTNLAVSWSQNQDKFIANQVFPVVPVKNKSDLYTIYLKGHFYRDEMRERPLGERNRRAGYKTTSGTYNCIEEGLSHPIDDRVRANADQPLDPDRAGMRLLTGQALIHQDRTWAGKYFKTGVWATDITGVASGPTGPQVLQFNQSGSDPVGVVDQYRDGMAEAGGYEGNVLVMGRDVFRTVKNHASIIDRVKYTQRGVLTKELLAEIFGVDKVIVPGGVQNTAAEGQTDAISFIIPKKSMLLAYAAPAPSLDEPSAGYSFAWTDLIPGAGNAFGGVIQRHRDEEAHSDVLEIRVASDQKAVATELGVFFSGAVA